MEYGTDVDVRLQGTTRTPDSVRLHTAYTNNPVTTSRDEFIQLEEDDIKLWLSSDSSLYSDQYMQTSFNAFLLNTVMDPLVGFSVGRMTSEVDGVVDTRVAYDSVLVDTHNCWNAESNAYMVPIPGVYVVTVQVGVYPAKWSGVRLFINSIFQFLTTFEDLTHNGTDFVSRTMIVELNEGDQVYTVFGHSICGDIRYPTSLMGFLLSPYRSVPICWSVARQLLGTTVGPTEPVIFDITFTNYGGGWNEVQGQFVAPLGGVYYITMTAGVPAARAKMELMVNGVATTNIHHESYPTSSYFCTFSRAIILRLQQYDELHIRVPSGYYLTHNSNRLIFFSGFRIYV